MAGRGIALGRIIDWGRNVDPEELSYVLVRLTQIAKERAAKVDLADAAGKVKRTRKAKSAVAVIHTDESAHLDAPERGASA